MSASWDILLRITLLLAAAALAGVVARRFGQSTIVGYILAGLLLGPGVLSLVSESGVIHMLSELGVALLLFSIGLEFSLSRLRSLGRIALVGGTLQIALTSTVVGLALFLALDLRPASAVVIGMALSLGSTAVVLRTLGDRAELDSVHGRNSLAILLMQDVAVLPLLIAEESLASSGTIAEVAGTFLMRLGLIVIFGGLATVIARHLLPYLLSNAAASGNRDVPVLLAICISMAATWSAHALGFSPALGAFMAGVLLAESPFATQIRSDITPLSAAFVALFFTSIGTLAVLPLTLKTLLSVGGLTVALLSIKAVVTCLIVWFLQRSLRAAVLTSLTICQAGEFSFVLAASARDAGLIDAELFRLLIGVTVASLILTPYLIDAAPAIVARILRAIPRARRVEMGITASDERLQVPRVLVAGYGPAGQGVVDELRRRNIPFLVLELNPRTVEANRTVLPIELGDAMQREVLLHAHLGQALAFVVTPPDPMVCRAMIALARELAPNTPVIARSRYGIFTEQLRSAGAVTVVNEEQMVGLKLAEETVEMVTARTYAQANTNATVN